MYFFTLKYKFPKILFGTATLKRYRTINTCLKVLINSSINDINCKITYIQLFSNLTIQMFIQLLFLVQWIMVVTVTHYNTPHITTYKCNPLLTNETLSF